MPSWGLVLAGGGAKGAYHLGVWQALRDLDIDVGCIAGTSIGSINGALFCQGAFDEALALWEDISIDKIVDMTNLDIDSNNLFEIKNIRALLSEFHKHSGLTMQPLNELLLKIVDEEKIRRSPVEYGLVTCSVPNLAAVELFKEQIPPGELVDYMMASACLPGFRTKKINNQAFVDGGVANNMPLDMPIQKGFDNIIAVDVGGIGVVRSVDTTAKNIIHIRCKDNMIGTMEFEQKSIQKIIKKGYYDTFRAMGRLAGQRYYFNIGDYCRARARYSPEILNGIERAAEIFGIDPIKVYKVDDLIAGVLRGYEANIEKQKDGENFFENLMKLKIVDKTAVARLARIIKSKNLDFMANRIIMGLLGANFWAANAIAYFLESEQ